MWYVPVVALMLCSRGDLGRGLAFSEGGGGNAVGGLVVTNVGSSACAVRGVPRVTLLSARSRPLDVSEGPMVRPERLRYHDIVLQPGQRVEASLFWMDYCRGPDADRVRLTWRGFAVTLHPSGPGWMRRTRCDFPAEPSSLGVGRFRRP